MESTSIGQRYPVKHAKILGQFKGKGDELKCKWHPDEEGKKKNAGKKTYIDLFKHQLKKDGKMAPTKYWVSGKKNKFLDTKTM